MGSTIYLLCAFTSILAAALLVRGYRRSRVRLMFWSSACFALLAVNNMILFVDLVLVRDVSLALPRSLSALAAASVLVYGLVWDFGDGEQPGG